MPNDQSSIERAIARNQALIASGKKVYSPEPPPQSPQTPGSMPNQTQSGLPVRGVMPPTMTLATDFANTTKTDGVPQRSTIFPPQPQTQIQKTIAVVGTGTSSSSAAPVSTLAISTGNAPNPVQTKLNFIGQNGITIVADANGNEIFSVSSESFAGAWNSTTNYTTGEIVNVGSALYIALQNNTNENPTTTSGFWSLLTGNSIYLGAWSNATAYQVGQTVSYTDGNFYICVVANTNVPPAPTGSTDWVLLGTSNTLIGAYSGTTAYVTGNEVTNAGNIFQALQSTTGNAPPTPPATNAFWQLMGPTTLGSVPDGGGTYGGTAASLSYIPNINPLTSVDAGASATVNIASFLLVIRNRSITSDVSYNSGSITGLSYGTVYYIYVNDPNMAGGTVTYLSSTTKSTVMTDSGNIFVGSIFTAVSGGATTVGNNDGGSAASQGGLVNISHPSTTSNSGTNAFSNPGNCIDGNPTTFAQSTGAGGFVVASGFAGVLTGAAPSGIVVNVLWKGIGTGSPVFQINTSINGGASFTNKVNRVANFAQTTDTVSLGVNVNPALIQVQIEYGSASTGSNNIDCYEIYLSITY